MYNIKLKFQAFNQHKNKTNQTTIKRKVSYKEILHRKHQLYSFCNRNLNKNKHHLIKYIKITKRCYKRKKAHGIFKKINYKNKL